MFQGTIINLLKKKTFIELLDKEFFSFLKEYAVKNKVKLIVTADHSTPCCMKTHTADPVPVLLYDMQKSDNSKSFSESEAKKGVLGKFIGRNLLKKTGFF